MRRPRPLVVLLAGALGACAPWYRDDELRGQTALTESRAALAEADAHHAAGRRSEALAAYERAVEANARSGDALLGLGRAYADSGRRERARVALLLAQEAGGEAAERARAELVRLALAEGRHGEALDRLGSRELSAAMAVPELAVAYGGLERVRAAAAAGRPGEALELYAAWLSSYGLPDHPSVRGWSDAALVQIAALVAPMLAAGDQALAADDELGALARYAQAYRYLPSPEQSAALQRLAAAAERIASPDVLSPRALALAAEADAALEAGRVGEAAASWRRAAVAAPWSATIRHEYALCLGATERYDEAVRQLDAYLALAGPSTDATAARRLRAAWAEGRPQ
jgi:tetratricopeptide (TPR) repeat protein